MYSSCVRGGAEAGHQEHSRQEPAARPQIHESMSKGVVNLANVPELESADGEGRSGEAFVKVHGQKGDDAEVNVALWDKMYAVICLHRRPDDFRCFKEGWRKANATTQKCIIRF